MLCKEQEQRIKFTVIVANEPNTDQLYLQKSTWFLFTSVSFGTPVSFKVQLNKNTLKQAQFEDKTVKPLTFRLLSLIASMIFQIFQTVRCMREAWKRETYKETCSVSVCLVPIRRLSKPSQSMDFGDVSETRDFKIGHYGRLGRSFSTPVLTGLGMRP